MIRLVLALVVILLILQVLQTSNEGYDDVDILPECPTECDEMFGACPYTGQVCVRGRCVKIF